ncbi:hypothetical protein LZ32DRAFT_654594 [Colletotrichum eremochloae]|nr:hypothetical protein LZ32DRAFT_654594 [Colletotrichum eremochloae]
MQIYYRMALMTRLAGAAEEENDDDDPPDPPEEGAATPVSQGTRYEELLKNPTQDYPTGICSMRKVTSDDPNLLPSVELLRLRDRVMAMMTLKGGADVDDDVLSSSSGGDDAPRVLVGDGDFEVDLEDRILKWSERAGGELAPLTA